MTAALVYALVHLAFARVERAPHPWLTALFQVRRIALATAWPLLALALVRLDVQAALLFGVSALTYLDRYPSRLVQVGHAGAGKPAADATPAFKVCTLNAGAHRSDPQRIARFLAACDADVVAVQEIGPDHVRVFEDALAQVYPHQVLFGRGVSGIGILSRHPVLEDELLQLAGPNPYLRATIDVHGAPVRFLAVHPMASIAVLGEASSSAPDCPRLAEIAMEGPACVVLGDFNTTDETAAYDVFVRAGLSDAYRTARGARGATFPVPLRYLFLPVPPLVRIDFVLHTGHLAPISAQVGADAGSDHLPVLAELAWTREPVRRAEPAARSVAASAA